MTSHPPLEDGNRSSFRNVVFSSFYNTGRWTKSKKPVILNFWRVICVKSPFWSDMISTVKCTEHVNCTRVASDILSVYLGQKSSLQSIITPEALCDFFQPLEVKTELSPKLRNNPFLEMLLFHSAVFTVHTASVSDLHISPWPRMARSVQCRQYPSKIKYWREAQSKSMNTNQSWNVVDK
jgi:hypothetical protein